MAPRATEASRQAALTALTAQTAADVHLRFDQLEDRLFGEGRVDPGILVRMDDRLTHLEGNPAIVLGRMARGIVGGLITLAGIIYGLSHLTDIYGFLKSIHLLK